MLKLIMAVSKDGFVSMGPNDDMSWTGSDDKKAFRLLTSVGGVLGAGRKTFEQLPQLKGRKIYCLSMRYNHVMRSTEVQLEVTTPSNKMAGEQTLSLSEFAYRHTNGWLIGGQTIALEALRLGLVDQVFLCHAPIELNRYGLLCDPRVAQRDLISHHISDWSMQDRISIGKTAVEVWRRK